VKETCQPAVRAVVRRKDAAALVDGLAEQRLGRRVAPKVATDHAELVQQFHAHVRLSRQLTLDARGGSVERSACVDATAGICRLERVRFAKHPDQKPVNPMRPQFHIASLFVLASSIPVAGCDPSPVAATPTGPSRAAAADPAAARSVPNAANESPQERAVLAAMEALKQAIIDADVAELARTWTDHYTFINPQGAIVTRAQRLANLASGNTDVSVIDDEREITVRVYGDMAVVQNLSTLHGRFNGVPTDTDLRGTFVWIRRDGRWRLVTNQLTAVTVSPSS